MGEPGRGTGRRVAFFTPLPPSPSGVAQYSAELLPALARSCTLDVFVPDGSAPPDSPPAEIRILPMREFAGRQRYDTLVYQVANNPAHAAILELAERVPGVCVLHDVTLQHLQGFRALHGPPATATAYREEMQRRYGAAGAAAADDLFQNRPAAPAADSPLCERVVEGSLATIVHSRYARERVLERCPGAPVAVVPHGVPLRAAGGPSERAAARRHLGLPDGAFVVAALGNLIPEKRLEVALGAFARALFGLPAAGSAAFVIAGAASPHYSPADFIRLHGLDPVVHSLGPVDAESFEALLLAADACVNLRWPTGGETSGSLLRMLAAGRPTLVSAVGSFDEVPDDACLKTVPGPKEEGSVVWGLLRLARDPDWGAAIGARARAFIAREHSLERAAAGYVGVMRRSLIVDRGS
ncbi:MAG: hypothetical protein AVDCRST_MAG88-1853 [uncultured Thermomicrobiales bacterium]|uniref:Glycosyltransferase subfamily 4-like N-terminal domain-containing protein n=1 Tax=uncultured Thermomicrobiales bacterium TaxID=1645740 RepID=A0A6J4V374_9BACT|nr:MAG: hypothetical protein AVDCRST_MAG88-1853 [uncultured Thermomicrobiales bacterium]